MSASVLSKTAVRLLAAAALAVGIAPVVAGSASADDAVLSPGSCGGGFIMGGTSAQVELTDAGTGGGFAGYGLVRQPSQFPGGLPAADRCLEVLVRADRIDNARDRASIDISYRLDGELRTGSLPFDRSAVNGDFYSASVTVPDGATRLTDIDLALRIPRTVLSTVPYTDDVACTSVGVREVEREVVRKVPSIVTTTRTETRKASPAERYSARTALHQQNVEARTRYVVPAKKAAARGNTARAKKLMARFVAVRAANVQRFEDVVAPRTVTVPSQEVVYRDATVTEKVNETYDKLGTCTVSGTRLVATTTDQHYTAPRMLPSA